MSIDVATLSNYVSSLLTNKQDQRTRDELFDYDLEKNKFDIRFKISYLRTRKWVGFCTFFLVWFWLLVMLFIVIANGMGKIPFTCEKFNLSDTIIVTLITTATLNVVAFLTIVIKNLFPDSNGK